MKALITGASSGIGLDMARYLSDINKPIWIRHVLVPGINSDEESLTKLHEFISTLNNVYRIDVLPYHTLGVFKWKELGIKYGLESVPTPTKEEVELARKILCVDEYNRYKNA